MADILISKFTTQISRVGATPATPGFAESEGQDPVAPSGTPIQYGIGAGLSLDSLNQIQLGFEDYTGNRTIGLNEWQDATSDNYAELVIGEDRDNPFAKSYFYYFKADNGNGVFAQALQNNYQALFDNTTNQNISGTRAVINLQASNDLSQQISLKIRVSDYSDGNGTNYAFFTDQINNKGIEYFSDYESNFTARSLVTKQYVDGAISGAGHNPVTIGSPANGLSISGTQVLTIGLASTSTTGALSSTDWNTFNNKLNLTSPITGYTVGANTALADTDTILQAFGKVQGQINARLSGTIQNNQVAVGTGPNLIAGYNDFVWDNTNRFITITDVNGTTRYRGSQIQFLRNADNYISANAGSPSQIYFETAGAWRWRITQLGVWLSNGSQSISSSTGNLTLSTLAGNGNILLTPNGTGLVMIGSGTPTNLLDVNGTARIRTINNLGSAATSVLVPSATGVVSLRTLAELASDGSFLSETTQTVTTSGAINDLTSTGTTIVFTGTTVTLSGIVAIGTGLERTLINRTGSVLTLLNGSALSTAANRFLGGAFVANNSAITLKYNSNLSRWIIVSGPFYSQETLASGTIGFRSDNPLAINRQGFDNVGLTIQSIAGTSYSILTYNNSSAITFEVQNTTASFPNVNLGVRRAALSNVALVAQSPASDQFAFGLYTSAGANGAFVNNSMEWTSIGGAGFGVTAGGSPTARVDIRGRGTTTGQTLLLEDSAGTDNAEFIDNGQIRFLRLPTSSAGLAAGSLWNNGGVLNIV